MKSALTLALFLLAALVHGYDIPAGNVEFIRLDIEIDDLSVPEGERRDFFSEKVIQLAEGDIVELLDLGYSGESEAAIPEVAVNLEGPYVQMSINSARFNRYFVGPGFLRVHMVIYHSEEKESRSGFGYAVFAIVRSGNTVTAYSDQSGNLVIPENASGPVQIILEQSADMINWTNANPGTYDAGEGKRFFRLRAVVTK